MTSELYRLLETADRIIAAGRPLPVTLAAKLMAAGVDVNALTGWRNA